jgi:WXG100 family type VII secretion target
MSQDGFIFTDYKDGHFTKGFDPNRGQNFTIDYLGNNDVKWVYGQDDWVEYDQNGNGIALQTPGHEATTFTAQFDLMATIAKVTRAFRGEISGNLDGMKSWLNDVDLFWNGAAHETFKTYHGTITQASDNLLAALDEAINRLETTHQNYVDAEGQSAKNVNPHR